MSDPKITNVPAAPAEWDLPEEEAPTTHTADRSFNDDHVAARVKLDEAARSRVAVDRFASEKPRAIEHQFEKVGQATAFRPAHEDNRDIHRDKRSASAARQAERGTDAAPARSIRERSAAQGDALSSVEERLTSLMARMEELTGAGEPVSGAAEPSLLSRLARLEQQTKYALQLLLAGGIGFVFLSDRRLAFKRWLDRLRRWPPQVRPGRMPETDEEFDDFLGWVFAPPPAPDETFETF